MAVLAAEVTMSIGSLRPPGELGPGSISMSRIRDISDKDEMCSLDKLWMLVTLRSGLKVTPE